jgi:mRNA interferase MazF
VLVEQLRTVDLERLDDRVGHLTVTELRAVEDAVELVLGL